MKEQKGNLFELDVDVICILTNGKTDINGNAVMGAGVALQAKRYDPRLPVYLGQLLQAKGNKVHSICNSDKYGMWSFPTKHHWKNPSDLKLIETSCKQAMELADEWDHFRMLTPLTGNHVRIALPRPGCGLGKLDWETQVKPICEKGLDDRFVVVNR